MSDEQASEGLVVVNYDGWPRQRFKVIPCPFPIPDRIAAMEYATTGVLRNVCGAPAWLFYRSILLCPIHGVGVSAEPWGTDSGSPHS